MSAKIIDGKAIAAKVRENIGSRVAKLKPSHGRAPGLAVVLVGEDPASQVYVRSKERACEKTGILSLAHKLHADTPQEELIKIIEQLNDNPEVDGILVQLPLPEHIDEKEVLYKISPEKDVDGFHPFNLGCLLLGEPTFQPCTPYGIQIMLAEAGCDTAGKHVVVLGRSNIVGKPMAMMLVQKNAKANATVTVCHSRTKDLPTVTRSADILIAAIGQPEFVKADMVKEGCVVIDVGINRVDDPTTEKGYKLVGDVAFDEVAEKASAISPVPGGVGPMTIAMLLQNTLKSFERKVASK